MMKAFAGAKWADCLVAPLGFIDIQILRCPSLYPAEIVRGGLIFGIGLCADLHELHCLYNKAQIYV